MAARAGTGLGLSISRGFIEAMGGTITRRKSGLRKRGTRIVIRLPAAVRARRRARSASARERTMRILVVDDEPQIQRFLQARA